MDKEIEPLCESPLKRAPRKKSVRANKGERVSDRKFLSREEIEELNELFSDYMRAGKTPPIGVINRKRDISRTNGGLVHKYDARKIQKRLSNMIIHRSKTKKSK